MFHIKFSCLSEFKIEQFHFLEETTTLHYVLFILLKLARCSDLAFCYEGCEFDSGDVRIIYMSSKNI